MTLVAPSAGDLVPAEVIDRSPSEVLVDLPASKPKKRGKTSLRDRLQSESSSFAFDSLLHESAAASQTRTSVNPRDGAELVWIAPGEFTMGSRDDKRQGECGRTIFLNGFWIYRSPVTVGQYRRFYQEIGRNLKHPPQWGWDDEHPIVNVSWSFAHAYAQWAGADLPKETEWERAAGGASGRRFPWGNEWDPSRCHNSVATRQFGTSRVCHYNCGASPEGVEDMAGNVWEWTADWFEPPSQPGLASYDGLSNGSHRVLRGGSWGNEHISDFDVTVRVPCDPDARGESIGFRCVVRSTSVCLASP